MRASAAAFFERARARLAFAVPAGLTDPTVPVTRGDLDLDPTLWTRAGVSATRPAAVLVPVVDHGEPTVLLTQRTAELPSHAGQIAFPGGKIDPDDDGPLDAALREAEEEIGLDPARVGILGELPLYQTVTGFRIHPVVGWITPPFELRPDPFEVAEAFEVPLHFVLDPENHRRQSYRRGPVTRGYYVLPYQGRFIWGATAGILVNLARLLRG